MLSWGALQVPAIDFQSPLSDSLRCTAPSHHHRTSWALVSAAFLGAGGGVGVAVAAAPASTNEARTEILRLTSSSLVAAGAEAQGEK